MERLSGSMSKARSNSVELLECIIKHGTMSVRKTKNVSHLQSPSSQSKFQRALCRWDGRACALHDDLSSLVV